MKTYKVNKSNCYVYKVSEVPPGIEYREDWRDGLIGDWVKTDDNHVMQILRRFKTGSKEFIGTCTGTYIVSPESNLDSIRNGDIYSLSGKNWYERLTGRKEPTKNEILFAQRISLGSSPTEAYLAVYNTDNEDTAKKKSAILIKQERIQKLVRQDLKDTFSKLGVDLDYLIESAKDVVDGAKNDSDRLKALGMLWQAFGVVEEQKVTEIKGVFQGFSPKELMTAERGQIESKKEALPEHAE